MIDVYYWPTPNGHKITIFLEEVGLEYKVIPINIGKGDQFAPEFLKISPNNRMRRSSITTARTARRWRSSNPARFCSISQARPDVLCQRKSARATRLSNG